MDAILSFLAEYWWVILLVVIGVIILLFGKDDKDGKEWPNDTDGCAGTGSSGCC